VTVTAEATDPTPPERGADVRVVPPAVFAAAFAVAALADRWHHIGVPGGRRARPLGVGLMAAGAGLAASGAATFRRHRTTVIPHRPVSTFVTAGPYRFTRNPMYTGLSLCHAGGALVLGSAWPLATLPAAVVGVRRLVIDREERYLTERFGEEYEAYRRTVRRWL
jgi:protein-S-isoprenylcysteine O-methyltransferase Ste14